MGRLLSPLTAILSLTSQTWALPQDSMASQRSVVVSLDVRAAPDSPSGNYAPAQVTCPSDRPVIRLASSLSEQEASWLPLRRNVTIQPMIDFLTRANIANFDAAAYINQVRGNPSELPNIAIAVSGGGYRALMNGAGFVAAADDRTAGATEAGGIGGLLQASTYLAGLSGGGWLVGSIYSNNFSSVQTLQAGSPGSDVWAFQNSIFSGPEEDGLSILNTADYWTTVATEVNKKDEAGFDTSITDYWGRALSYQLINATDGGPSYTFSSIAEDASFTSGQSPFPILVSDGRAPGEKLISLNATVYEFNPFETGSWDPTTFGFAPTKYLASNFSAGVVPQDGACVEGFDQAGFVMGTSSSLFNQFLLQNITAITAELPSFLSDLLKSVLTTLDEDSNDIAQYAPNPFRDWRPDTNPNANQFQLTLVDGGEDLQNIPLHPLIQPMRAVDVIFSVDSSADTTYNWPNGTALRASYDRSGTPIANGTVFPPVPDANTFINLRLNQRPTFFGCDPANFTLSPGQVVPPLVVYIPNAPYTTESNVSTFTPSYELSQRNLIIQNGYNAASQGNSTVDTEWAACVACAVLSRSFGRTGTTVPDVCTGCFQRYCWNGTLDTREVESYEPPFIIGEIKAESGAARTQGSLLGLVVGAVAVMLLW